uniref:Uncharacterized protein n=1 Tax=Acrobeloides nanus TaxID=290746 RepID=A0A914E8P6_9BILA
MDNDGGPTRSPLENSPYIRIFTDKMIDGEPPSRDRQLIVSIDILKTILRSNVINRIKSFAVTQNWRNEGELIKLLDLLYEADIESIGHVECLLNATRNEFWFSIVKILQKFSPLDFTCCSERVLVFLNEEMRFKKFVARNWLSKFTIRHIPIPNNFDFITAELFSLALADHVDPVVLKMLNQIQAETMELYSLDGHWSIINIVKSMEINTNHPIKNLMWFVNTRQCAFFAETFEAVLITLPNLEYFTVVNALPENIVFFRNEFIGSELVVLDSTLATFKSLLNNHNYSALFTFQALFRITIYDLEDCYIILNRLLQALSRHAVVKKVAEYRDHLDPTAEPKTDLPDIKILDLDSLTSIPFTDTEKAGNLNEIKHEISGQINEQRLIQVEIIIAYTQKDTYDFT